MASGKARCYWRGLFANVAWLTTIIVVALHGVGFAAEPPLIPSTILTGETAPAETNDSTPNADRRQYIAGSAGQDYLLGPQDLLKIDVFQVQEFSRTVRVSAAGKISLPLVGAVQAAGLTTAALEQLIAQRLSETYLQEPYVSVFVEEYASQRVTVEGQVRKPGIYALKGRTTLLQAVALAEGLLDLADAQRVQIFRLDATGRKVVTDYDIEAVRSGTVEDPVLLGDDVIVVQKAPGRSFMKALTDTLRGFVIFGGSL